MTNEELLQQYQNGDASALEQLYVQNIGLIKRIAEQCLMDFGYLPSDKNISGRVGSVVEDLREELFSEGTLAFCEQIKSGTYDSLRGKLTTYLYPFIRGAMYRCLERYQGEQTHTVSISNLTADDKDCDPVEFVDKRVLPVDWIVYRKICIEWLQEIFEQFSDKDKSILGHSFGVYGYKKYSLDELGLKEMLTTDGVLKAKRAALSHLEKIYEGSPLQFLRVAHGILSMQHPD